ncbi:MAG: TRAP transporter small permease subunit [Pseudomonadota bacterium]
MKLKLPHTALSRGLEAPLNWLGQTASWLWPLLMLVIVGNVILRYFFGEGRIELEELQWHLYAAGFLLALSYADIHDSHIRVDVLHERCPPRIQAWIELYGTLLLVLPFLSLVLYFSGPFVVASWSLGEVSQSPGGLPYRWLIKGVLPLGFALLLLATIARLSRLWSYLSGSD